MKRLFACCALALAAGFFGAAGDAPKYPAPVKKELYGNDLRGKAAPVLVVEKWLSEARDAGEGSVDRFLGDVVPAVPRDDSGTQRLSGEVQG